MDVLEPRSALNSLGTQDENGLISYCFVCATTSRVTQHVIQYIVLS
jgi:hypothetical protein